MLRTLTTTSIAALVASSFFFVAQAHDHEDRDKDKSDYDIAKIAKEDDRFSTFAEALKAADMEDALDSDGSYTLFAPTNDAFDALPEGTLESLLESDNQDRLRDILSYHIVEEKLMSDDINGDEVRKETLQGSEVRITASYGNVQVNNATVTYPDIEASNGVIHGIDTVIMPTE
ncbi:fasciclin domain-containing protein [Aliidiomarina minuta]|nr:fasciclin domain-containing protein [Aliidiomarina minuta]